MSIVTPPTAGRMTRAGMRQAARRARQFGYYATGTTLAVFCPRCGSRIETARQYGYKPAGKGKPHSAVIDGRRCIFRQESVTEALDRAMIAHLTYADDECQERPR